MQCPTLSQACTQETEVWNCPKKTKEEKVSFYKTEKRILLLYSVNNFCVSGTQICAIFKVGKMQPIEFGLNPLAWAHKTPLLKSPNNGFPR